MSGFFKAYENEFGDTVRPLLTVEAEEGGVVHFAIASSALWDCPRSMKPDFA
ncbi:MULTISPECIES: hypothetical protein [unclassified Sinorhizobium]|uniref:hypothetical protein n=1 Tax=unclassified Sinorhizobium TaxID=2613772 RepID=UPI0035254010